MLQAAIGDCLAFDALAFEEDARGASKIDVSRGEIAQALVIAGMVVMVDEGGDLAFEIAGQVIMLEQDAILERLMPALDFALGLRMVGRSADMLDVLLVQPIGKIARDL
jgi:hypothetical protein